MSIDRDMKMGRALESIPLPELREGFYSELVVRLEQARPAPALGLLRPSPLLHLPLVSSVKRGGN